MKNVIRLSLALLLLSFSHLSVSAGMYDTRDDELEMYDQELNTVYHELMKTLDTVHQNYLKQAQRAWMVMRDSDCKWAFADVRDCLIDRTVNRTEELRRTWYQTENGDYISLKP